MIDTQIIPHSFDNLGGKRRPQNDAEPLAQLPKMQLGGAAIPVYTFPATKPKPAQRTYYMQGKQPACGAHAGTSLMDSTLMQKAGAPLQNNTPRDLWINIKKDGTDPNDGTSMDRIFAVLESVGVVPFEPLENNVTYDIPDYAEASAITPAVEAQQGKNKALQGKYLTDMSFNGLKQAINDYGAVIVLLDVCARLYENAEGQTSWAAADVCPLVTPSAQFPVIDGHFVIFDYYDEDTLFGANSFSQQWGLDGDVSMKANYLPWVIEAGVITVPVAPVTAPTPLQTIQATLPKVQQDINELPNLSPEVKAQHVSWIETILQDLEQLAHASSTTTT